VPRQQLVRLLIVIIIRLCDLGKSVQVGDKASFKIVIRFASEDGFVG
jgi:hypothetical protein